VHHVGRVFPLSESVFSLNESQHASTERVYNVDFTERVYIGSWQGGAVSCNLGLHGLNPYPSAPQNKPHRLRTKYQ
jgi:hypothetical protein